MSEYAHPSLGTVRIVRSERARRLTLSVRASGEIRLTIPRGMNEREALRFLDEKQAWAEKEPACRAAAARNDRNALLHPQAYAEAGAVRLHRRNGTDRRRTDPGTLPGRYELCRRAGAGGDQAGNRAGVENRGTAIPARTRGRAVPRTGIPLRKSDRPQQPHALGQLLVEKRPLAEPPSDETARPADRLYPDPRAVPYAAPKSRPRLPCLARSNDRRQTQAAAKRAERLFDPVGPMIPCDGFRPFSRSCTGTRRAGNREAARTMSAPCRRSSLAETSLNRKEQGDRETADSDLFTQPRNSL